MLIIAPIYKVKPKDVKLFPYVRISRNLALVSASRQEINQAFDIFMQSISKTIVQFPVQIQRVENGFSFSGKLKSKSHF